MKIISKKQNYLKKYIFSDYTCLKRLIYACQCHRYLPFGEPTDVCPTDSNAEKFKIMQLTSYIVDKHSVITNSIKNNDKNHKNVNFKRYYDVKYVEAGVISFFRDE
jgi:hypothetical protein